MKTGYLSSDNPYILLDNKYIGSIYQAIGWIGAANFFIIIKAWGVEDTTGYLIFSKTSSLWPVHIEATFMDLKNATRYAELLGHLKYSRLIQDCFYDVHSIIRRFQGEIYQYVGDEIVITWKSTDGLKNNSCLHLFFEYKNKLLKRSKHYKDRYGFIPDFKAGMNCGHITIAEVGISKREIAYHGDVINTASRIQHKCNSYGKQLLISGQMKRRLGNVAGYRVKTIDSVLLKGKNKPVELFSVEA
jgi:adenylate cyclase